MGVPCRSAGRAGSRRGARLVAAASACALAWSCSHDWDAYDPRLAGGAASTTASVAAGTGGAGSGGATGAGGATASTSGTAGGAGATGSGGGPAVTALWSKSFGGAGDQHGHRVATDAAGNVYVTGHFGGTLDFGGGPLVAAGQNDVFVAKLAPDGSHLWSKRFGGALDEMAQGIAVAPTGDLMIVGRFQGTVSFGGADLVSAGDYDAFVAELDPSGATVCSARFGDAAVDLATEVAAEDDGDFDVIGMFFGTIDLGAAAFTSGGDRDVFFARLGGGGCSPFAAKSFPGPGGDYGWSIASIAGSGVVLGIDSNGSLDFGGGVLSNAGGDDAFIPRLLGDGTHVWSRRFGDGAQQWAPHVAVGPGDAVVGAASFQGTIDAGPAGSVTSAGSFDVYVLALDAQGDPLWVRGYGDAAEQHGEELHLDAGGNVLVTGRARGAIDFGAGPLASAGGEDLFVLKLDPDGNHLWSFLAGDGADQQGFGISADADGNVIVTGDYRGTLDLGAGAMTSQGGADLFVAKLPP